VERIKILVVDDEVELVSTLAERLVLRGFEVDSATTGAAALERLEQREFSVLLVDVKMPGLGGLELTAQIKRSYPHLPVILFTGHTSRDDAERGMQEGACDYLVKPIKIEELIEKIRKAVRSKESPER
jgi:DNA-binding NtrC family response regulator